MGALLLNEGVPCVPGCLLAWDDRRSPMPGYVRGPGGDEADRFARSAEELAGITGWLGGAHVMP